MENGANVDIHLLLIGVPSLPRCCQLSHHMLLVCGVATSYRGNSEVNNTGRRKHKHNSTIYLSPVIVFSRAYCNSPLVFSLHRFLGVYTDSGGAMKDPTK